MATRPTYYPQEPVNPKYFAGRQKVLAEFEKIIAAAVQGRAENAAVYGVRGIGKTSLLVKVLEQVPSSCFTAYYAVSREFGSKEFVDELLQKMELQYKTDLSKYRRFLERVKAVPSRIEEFSLFEISLALRKNEKAPQIALMEGILKFRERGFKAIFIFIDEADLVSNEVLAMVKDVVQEMRGPPYSFPIGIVVAGKDDLLKRLTDKLSPIGRFFSTHRFELEILLHDETKEALVLPAEELKVCWEEDAINFVYAASKGFPFIVQLYGKYALEQSNDAKIDLEDVRRSHTEVVLEVGASYEAGWKEKPSPIEMSVLLTIADAGGSASYSRIKKDMHKECGVYLKRLVSKRCLLQNEERSVYYFFYPLVGDYLKMRYKPIKREKNNSSLHDLA